MSAALAPSFRLQFFTKTFPIRYLNGGKVYSYVAGSTIPLATYTTAEGNVAHANPIILDENGSAEVWLGAGNYRFEVYSSTNVLQETIDNITVSAKSSSSFSSVLNYSYLRNLSPGIYDMVYVGGHTAPGDGGSGTFFWDSSSSASDDDGIVILPSTNPSSGRWIRQYSGVVNAAWFGVINDGSDVTTALKNAILSAHNLVNVLYIPFGQYLVTTDINFICDTEMDNDASFTSSATIKLTFDHAFLATNTQKFFGTNVTCDFSTSTTKVIQASWFQTLAKAVSAIGAGNYELVITAPSMTVAAPLVIPVTTVTTFIYPGSIDNSANLLNIGKINNPANYQIFKSSNVHFVADKSYPSIVTPEWFGAVGDGVTDDAQSFIRAVAFLDNGGIIQCDSPVYLIGTNVIVGVNHVGGYGITVKGNGCGTLPGVGSAATTILKKHGMSTPVFTLGGLKDGCSGFTIDDQDCYNNNNHVSGSTGVGILVLCGRSRLEDIAVFNMGSDGIRYGDDTVHYNLNSWYAKNICTKYNGGTGFNMKGEFDITSTTSSPDCNAGRLDGLDSQFNGVYGIYTQQATANVFNGIQCEFNTSHGLHVGQGSASNQFIGGDLNEANADLTDHYNVYEEDNIYDQINNNYYTAFTCNENLFYRGVNSTSHIDIPSTQGNATFQQLQNQYNKKVQGRLSLYTGNYLGSPDTGDQLHINALTTVTNKAARLATTTNINLSNPGTATFDGYTAIAGDKILVKDQATPSQNGLYKFLGSAIAMTRSTDMAAGGSAVGKVVYVTQGTVAGGSAYEVVGGGPIVVGTNDMPWQLATTGTYAQISLYQDKTYMGAFLKSPAGDIRIDDASAIRLRLLQGGAMILNGLGTIQITDADNFLLGTTTGSQFGTAANQKLGFHGATPTIQQPTDSDPRTVQVTKGLVAAATQTQTTPGCMFTSSSSVTVVSTNAETTLLGSGVGSLTVKAAKLVEAKTIRIEGYGFVSTTGTPTLTIKFKIGGTEFCSVVTSPGSSVSGVGFVFKLDFTCFHTGSTGDGYAYGTVTINGTVNHMIGSLTTVNTTIDNALDVTAQWSASSSSNSVRTNITSIELLN